MCQVPGFFLGTRTEICETLITMPVKSLEILLETNEYQMKVFMEWCEKLLLHLLPSSFRVAS